MYDFMISLLTCSIMMSVLALVYMAVMPLLVRRYSAKGCYYAWLVVVIGLIIPFRPQADNAAIQVNVPGEVVMPLVQTGGGLPIENVVIPSVIQNISWWQVAVIVWAVGVAVLLAYYAIKHYRFVKMVMRWSERITDGQSFAILQDLKAEMGISKPINLCLCSCVGSPMLIGLMKPGILLPYTDFDNDELHLILKHELIHLRRNDLWYKALVLISTTIHWFNPIVCLMAKAIDTLCEISCDAETVQNTSTDMRLHYSETIIGVAKYQSKLKTALSTNFYGGKKGMKNRISSILDTGKKKVGAVVLCVALVGTLGTGFVFAVNVMSAYDGYGYFSRMEEQRLPAKTAVAVTFSDMAAWWDTGWGDDEFVLTFWIEGYSDISEYGIKCWDSNGKEIAYLDGPSHLTAQANGYFCIGAIQPDGSYTGSLVIGETYSWIAYAVRDGKRYESPVNTFVLSTEGTRFGQ